MCFQKLQELRSQFILVRLRDDLDVLADLGLDVVVPLGIPISLLTLRSGAIPDPLETHSEETIGSLILAFLLSALVLHGAIGFT